MDGEQRRIKKGRNREERERVRRRGAKKRFGMKGMTREGGKENRTKRRKRRKGGREKERERERERERR